MSSLLIRSGTLVTLNDREDIIENGHLYIEGEKIVEVGRFPPDKHAADRTLDAAGKIVMPGLINAHHHLYSTFARGFAPPGEPARNFKEILERLWWKLDYALDAEDVHASALIALMDAARSGCTTVIDHHASPSCRDGSLDHVERAFREVGLNGCLCYEVSDRNMEGAGIRENERFIRKCRQTGDGQMTALFGLHASMTLGAKTLRKCGELGRSLDTGFHVHVAEAECDEEETRARLGGGSLMERFRAEGITGEKSIFVHGIHLTHRDMDILKETDSMMVTNPESNMNNGLGVTPVLELLGKGLLVGLGTDGMSNQMIAQARAGYQIQRAHRRDPRVAFKEVCDLLLKNNRTLCGRLFHEPRGVLAPGALADVALYAYSPFTPFNRHTWLGHFLFGLVSAPVDTTVCRGRVIVEGGRLPHLDEPGIRARAVERATKLWSRIQ
jgi:putative selenium metabolism protein SsnA